MVNSKIQACILSSYEFFFFKVKVVISVRNCTEVCDVGRAKVEEL